MELDFNRLNCLEFTKQPAQPAADPNGEELKILPIQNIQKSTRLQRSIIEGLKAGEPVYRLLLQAVEAIALITDEDEYYSQIRELIVAIHGEGLEKDLPLRMALEDTQRELKKLGTVLKRKNLTPETRKALQEALTAHIDREAQLKEAIDRTAQLTLDDLEQAQKWTCNGLKS